MKQQLEELLSKDMTRHEFLATLGLGLVSMLGFSSALRFLLDHGSNNSSASNGNNRSVASAGYGSNPYGR